MTDIDFDQYELQLFRDSIIDGLNEIPNLYKHGWDFDLETNRLIIKRETGSILISMFYCEDRDTPIAFISTSFRDIDKTFVSIDAVVDKVKAYVRLLDGMNYDHHNKDLLDALKEAVVAGKGAYKNGVPLNYGLGHPEDWPSRNVDIEMKKDGGIWHLSRFSNDCHWYSINLDRYIQVEGVEITFQYSSKCISFWMPNKNKKLNPDHRRRMECFKLAFEYQLNRWGLLNGLYFTFNEPRDLDIQNQGGE